jgi:hypothetical protein
MPFKSFSDFDYYPGRNLLPSDYIVGYRELNAEFKTKIEDLSLELLKNLDLNVSPQVLYVSTAGKDTNSGRSEFSALRTIKRAAAKALEISRAGANTIIESSRDNDGTPRWGIAGFPVNIFVKTGDYIEDNPIYLPPCCTLIGDNLRAVSIIPKNKFYDIIWVNHRCYVWGFTFRRHKYPSYAIAYPEHQYINGVEQANFYNTRVAQSTARADYFYRNWRVLPNGEEYNATLNSDENENPENLSQDAGAPIYNPAEIAFLSRYFKGLNDTFFSEGELLDNTRFDLTDYHKTNVRRAYQLTSPYPQGNSSITQSSSALLCQLANAQGVGTGTLDDAGGGVLVDGFKVDGPTRSMVMDSFTQFNEGGKGIHIINNGYAQLVSTFTICCTEGVICESGGTCSINTSNCSFGLTGLAAYGKSPKPTLVGTLETPVSGLTNVMSFTNLSGFSTEQQFPNDFQPYPGQVFEIVLAAPVNNTVLTSITASNNGNMFSMLSCQKVVRDTSQLDRIVYKCDVVLDQNYSPVLDTSLIPSATTIIPPGSKVFFYIRSTITTSAHTMEYIGTGTKLLDAVPQKGGQTDVSKEIAFDTIGRVYFTSTNQFGDFRIGTDLTIVQATGTIEGETFERSILTIVTPFTIAIAASL